MVLEHKVANNAVKCYHDKVLTLNPVLIGYQVTLLITATFSHCFGASYNCK